MEILFAYLNKEDTYNLSAYVCETFTVILMNDFLMFHNSAV